MSIKKKPLVSIVISAFNEEGNVAELHRQLAETLDTAPVDIEMIFVNDGSTDRTLWNLCELQKKDKRVKIVNFTKNFGHEIAMIAGMDYSRGDAVVFMDADLQNPPATVLEMINLWRGGEKIVLTHRRGYANPGFFYKCAQKLFYFILNMLSDVKIPKSMPDFRLIDREYVTFLQRFGEHDVMFRGMLSLVTNVDTVKTIEYTSADRFSGTTKYNFSLRSVRLALDSVLQFSTRPLSLAAWMSGLMAILCALAFAYIVVQRFVFMRPTPEHMTIIAVVTFASAIILSALAIIGMYVGKIHLETKNRPRYFAVFIDPAVRGANEKKNI